MDLDHVKKEFVPKYAQFGEYKFYSFLLTYALNKLVGIQNGVFKGTSPEVEFLGYYDKFLVLYRREGDSVYLEMAKLFRKAGHRVYRIMLQKEMIEKNSKFLNRV